MAAFCRLSSRAVFILSSSVRSVGFTIPEIALRLIPPAPGGAMGSSPGKSGRGVNGVTDWRVGKLSRALGLPDPAPAAPKELPSPPNPPNPPLIPGFTSSSMRLSPACWL